MTKENKFSRFAAKITTGKTLPTNVKWMFPQINGVGVVNFVQ